MQENQQSLGTVITIDLRTPLQCSVSGCTKLASEGLGIKHPTRKGEYAFSAFCEDHRDRQTLPHFTPTNE